MMIFASERIKILCKQEKMLVTNIFFSSHNAFLRLPPQDHSQLGSCGIWSTLYHKMPILRKKTFEKFDGKEKMLVNSIFFFYLLRNHYHQLSYNYFFVSRCFALACLKFCNIRITVFKFNSLFSIFSEVVYDATKTFWPM